VAAPLVDEHQPPISGSATTRGVGVSNPIDV
jgi:hypothetical protein